MINEAYLEAMREHIQREEFLLSMCKEGNLFKIKETLLNIDDIEDLKNVTNNLLIKSCIEGKIEVVKFLLTSNDLKINADIYYDNPITQAAYHGHVDIIKYLCTSQDLKKHNSIHDENDLAFSNAAANGDIKVFKCLLNILLETEEIDYYDKSSDLLATALHNDKNDFAQYLLYDLNIPINPNIFEYTTEKLTHMIEDMVEKRDLLMKISGYLYEKVDSVKFKSKI